MDDKLNKCGVVYCYTNLINGKKYIGQTIRSMHIRHIEHCSCGSRATREDYPFHRAVKKYGMENFKLDILIENCTDYDKLNAYETFFIKRYKTLCVEDGYNVCSGGYNSNPYTMDDWRWFGYHHYPA